VAAASREGEPWIESADVTCPPVPADVADLLALSDGMALACFSRDPITFRSRLVACECDIDGALVTDPAWFGTDAEPILLVDPSDRKAPNSPEDWLLLHLDPAASASSIPVGQVVDVTGMFDHPAAEHCIATEPDELPVPSPACRFVFAVTEIAAVAP
jgi:hypothetical protein